MEECLALLDATFRELVKGRNSPDAPAGMNPSSGFPPQIGIFSPTPTWLRLRQPTWITFVGIIPSLMETNEWPSEPAWYSSG